MGADVMTEIRAAGITLSVDGADLVATPKAAITDGLRSLIRAHKPAILAALRHTLSLPGVQQEAEDLKEHFEGRVGILERAGLPKAEAELEAARSTTTLARNRGCLWVSLREALAGYTVPLALVPDVEGSVDGLVFGVPEVHMLKDRVVRQGEFSGAQEVKR
jgi:hypothetical protein